MLKSVGIPMLPYPRRSVLGRITNRRTLTSGSPEEACPWKIKTGTSESPKDRNIFHPPEFLCSDPTAAHKRTCGGEILLKSPRDAGDAST